nr:MAG TPA_asm: hypothetical protein [Caudoviricetes sp.]
MGAAGAQEGRSVRGGKEKGQGKAAAVAGQAGGQRGGI